MSNESIHQTTAPATELTPEQTEDLRDLLKSRYKGDEHHRNVDALLRFCRLENDLVELAVFDKGKLGGGQFGPCVAYGTLEKIKTTLLQRGEELGATGIYVTPATLSEGARYHYPHGQWVAAKDGTSAEKDVVESRVVVIDVDVNPLVNGKPVSRERNTTKPEWFRAIARGWMIRSWLVGLGVSTDALAFASSGNGCHIPIALEGAWSSEWKGLRERFLQALAKIWDFDHDEGMTYRIDPSMSDGGRFIPLSGTKKAKAADHTEYPQRYTWVVTPDQVAPLDLKAFSDLVLKVEAAVTPELQAAWEAREEREGKAKAKTMKAKSESSVVASGSGGWQAYFHGIDTIPITQVANAFGISIEKCPHCGAEKGDGFDLLEDHNILKCHHQTAGCGTHKGGVFNGVDLVRIQQAGGLDWQSVEHRRKAQDAIAERFDIAKPRGRRPKEPVPLSDDQLRRRAYGGVDPGDELCAEEENVEAFFASTEEPEAATEVLIIRALTDLGNAYRVIDARGDSLLRANGEWYTWRGSRWKKMNNDRARGVVIKVIERIPIEATKLIDEEDRNQLAVWGQWSQEQKRVDAAEKLARSLAAEVDFRDFDGDGWLLGCPNGVLDLRTSEFREHRREDLITRHIACDYNPEAKAPFFEKTLAWAQPDPEVRKFLYRLWGYSITGIVRDHVFPIHWGEGGNGKGTLLHTIRKMMGDYGTALPMDALVARKNDSHPATLSDLPGSRFVLAAEANEGAAWDEATIKRLTGGDGDKFRGMRENYTAWEQTWHLGVMINQKLRLITLDNAIRRRFLFIHWAQQITESEMDPALPEKLLAELPGVLNLLLKGLQAWQKQGLNPPARVKATTEDYFNENDGVAQFVAECCMAGEDLTATWASLLEEYTKWAKKRNENPLGSRRFGNELKRLGYAAAVEGKKNFAVRRGLALNKQADAEVGDVDLPEFEDEVEAMEISASVGDV